MALGYLPVIKHQTVYRVLNIRYTENTIATFNYDKTQSYEQRLEVKSNYVCSTHMYVVVVVVVEVSLKFSRSERERDSSASDGSRGIEWGWRIQVESKKSTNYNIEQNRTCKHNIQRDINSEIEREREHIKNLQTQSENNKVRLYSIKVWLCVCTD